jgi:hypothetical protein
VPLDRHSIERRDFPHDGGGYDPAAVDAHLRLLADEYEALRRRAGRGTESIASAAAEQVRVIVDAAERMAADLLHDAEVDSSRVRHEAQEEAERIRARAHEEARGRVQQVAEAAGSMLERVERIEGELGDLLGRLQTGRTSLSSELSLLQDSVTEVRGVAADVLPRSAEPPAPAPEAPAPSAEPSAPAEADGGGEHHEPGASGTDEASDEGARLIALNMALQGADRDETARYLAETFSMHDVGALLDDVYARAGR